MLLLDSFLLLLIIVILHIIKLKYPNFLFFCKGAILFLPPQQQQTQPSTQTQAQAQGTNKSTTNTKKPKKQQPHPQPQIKILQTQYKHVKQYPMSDQYDRIIFLITALIFYIPIKYIICHIIDYFNSKPNTIQPSSFTFILCLVALIYSIKIGLQIFWISSYNIKYCILFGIGINILFFMLNLSLSNLGTYDRQLQYTISDYKKQLSIIVGKQISQSVMNIKSILISILIFNVILTLISIPAVIKFGNWYTKTLKQIYYQDQTTAKIQNQQQRKQQREKQMILKKKSQRSIYMLNMYMVCVLVFLFFSHRYVQQFMDQIIVDIIRTALIAVITYINCYTLKDAIQFNGSFAYKFISQYLNTDNKQQKLKLRQKIVPYVYFIWYHKFQFMFRIIIPILLYLMIIDWKYMHPIQTNPLNQLPIISHTHCGINMDKLSILENLYKCSDVTPTTQIHQISQTFSNGLMIAGKRNEELSVTQERVARYGLLNGEFTGEFLETLLWYCNITVYGMTIVYILFLRKTVYDI